MEENWIKMNKHVLFSIWLIPRICNLVKKLDLFFQNKSNLPKLIKQTLFFQTNLT